MTIKNLKYLAVLVLLTISASSCDKFLNVEPIDALSGNNFWKNPRDVEGYMNGIYMKLTNKIGRSILLPSIDIRGNFVRIVQDIESSGNTPINNLISNNLRNIKSSTGTFDRRLQQNMDWKGWYDVIAASNILYFEVGRLSNEELSSSQRKLYQAEAVFTRNLSYMYLTKLYGDVIYYTDAYHKESLARTDQVEVLNKCIFDMLAVKDDLPIKYSESSLTGLRPTRGSAIALLMHLNMWAAAWDKDGADKYYEAVTALDKELATYSSTYFLLSKDVEQTKQMGKGRSPENLFSVLQDFNYGERFEVFANYSYFFSHYPYRGATSKTQSYMTYEKKYIDELFPVAVTDNRRTVWFDNIAADNNSFQFKKFANIYSTGAGASMAMFSDDSALIFRLADALLLAAEAYAELGDEVLASERLNAVREAAGASKVVAQGQALKEQIYMERCRELIGEGHFYFDLVRTKRVLDSKFTKSPMQVGQFNSRAWTWPLIISAAERTANPNLTDNAYWN